MHKVGACAPTLCCIIESKKMDATNILVIILFIFFFIVLYKVIFKQKINHVHIELDAYALSQKVERSKNLLQTHYILQYDELDIKIKEGKLIIVFNNKE